MLLYHSFPRPYTPDVRKNRQYQLFQHGIDQLAMMLEWGILLTPEDLVIPENPFAENKHRPKTRFPQARAAFTLAQRNELWQSGSRRDRSGSHKSHADLFGPFAIGIDPIAARTLGAIPVIYHYADEGDKNLTRELLFHIREVRLLALAHARIEAIAQLPNHDWISEDQLKESGLVMAGEPDVERLLSSVDTQEARRVAELFNTDRVPAWNLVDWIDIMLSLFQTVDSKSNVGSLAYYQQREWRIVRLFGPHVRCHHLGISNAVYSGAAMPAEDRREIRSRLHLFDPVFFTEERLDRSVLLQGTDDVPFFDFVCEIVCPVEAAPSVADLLGQARITERFRGKYENSGDVAVFESCYPGGG